MGTIVIEEYQKTGLDNNSYVPVYNLSNLVKRTADATTSTTAENITLQGNTNIIRFYTAEIHRIELSSANTDDSAIYFTSTVGWNELAVQPGDTVFYRTDV